MSQVYFCHVRKCGGRSLIVAFLREAKAAGADEASSLYQALCSKGRQTIGKRQIHGWTTHPPAGFHFAFSHDPMHTVQLPKGALRVTTLREPIARFLSYYRMLLHYHQTNNARFARTEGRFIAEPFQDFLEKVAPEHLYATLSMFSRKRSVVEAFQHITQLDQVIFVDNYANGLAQLSAKIGCTLELCTFGATPPVCMPELTADDMAALTRKLEPELELYRRVRVHFGLTASTADAAAH